MKFYIGVTDNSWFDFLSRLVAGLLYHARQEAKEK